jgi:hypothetical protein
MVVSSFNSGTRGIVHLIGEFVYFFGGIDVEKGALTTLYVATSPELTGVSGKYFSQSKQGKETPSSKLSYDVAIRRHLWEVSEELIDQSEHSHVALAK